MACHTGIRVSVCFIDIIISQSRLLIIYAKYLFFSAQAWISIKRLQEFLLQPETKIQKNAHKVRKDIKLTNDFIGKSIKEGKTIKDLDGDVTFYKIQHTNSGKIDEENNFVTHHAMKEVKSKRVSKHREFREVYSL